jgi:hypothetical protein
MTDKCYHGYYRAHLFPDTSSAQICNRVPSRVTCGADIQKIDPSLTKVTVYYSDKYYIEQALQMKKWIEGSSTECR